MDDSHKTPYLTIAVTTVLVGGCFVFAYFATPYLPSSTAEMRAQVSQALGVVQSESLDSSTQAVDWMSSVIRTQQQKIHTLENENKKLRTSLSLYASSSTSSDPLIEEEKQDTPHILLVAGHTAENPGATYKDLTEYELNYELMREAARQLIDAGYEVTTTHRGAGYSYRFSSFFEENEDRILEFREKQKTAYNEEYPQGVVTNDTDHNYASDKGVVQLYGVNLWANMHDVDAVLHIHFNDYPGRTKGAPGEHTGFSVFTSLKTNKNFIESFRLAKALEQQMLTHSERSTVGQESAGVLESELIAVGQANSVDAPAILLEGGFVYEDKFSNEASRPALMREYAGSIKKAFNSYFK